VLILSFILFILGAILVMAAVVVFPYRVKYLRTWDRRAFIAVTVFTGMTGAIIVTLSGALMLLSIL
jgi:hypothetical protein